jgi:autotransporter adhesin
MATGDQAAVIDDNTTAVGNGAFAIGAWVQATAEIPVALGAQSMADRANTVSVGSAGLERQITNVANGTQATDAVNLGQLQSANAYTDQKFSTVASPADVNSLRSDMTRQFHAVDKRLDQVGAMGAAMTQMAFSTQGINSPNRRGVGMGGYGNRAALAVGYSGQLSPKANRTFGAAVTGHETSGGVGVGIGWSLRGWKKPGRRPDDAAPADQPGRCEPCARQWPG